MLEFNIMFSTILGDVVFVIWSKQISFNSFISLVAPTKCVALSLYNCLHNPLLAKKRFTVAITDFAVRAARIPSSSGLFSI